MKPFRPSSPHRLRCCFAPLVFAATTGCQIDPRGELVLADAGEGLPDPTPNDGTSAPSSPSVDPTDVPQRPPEPECIPSRSNLVDNPDFDADVDGWSVPEGEEVVVSTHDEHSFTDDSGALALRLDMSKMESNPGAVRMIGGVVQCLPIDAETEYNLATAYRIDQGDLGTSASLTAFQYETADCSGQFLEVWSSVEGTAKGEWQYLLGHLQTLEGVSAIGLRLNVAASANAASGLVLYDEVYLSQDPLCSEAPSQAPTPDDDEPHDPSVADAGTVDGEPTAPEPDTDEQDDDVPSRDEPASGDAAAPAPTASDPNMGTTSGAQEAGADTETQEPPASLSYAADVEPIVLANCVNACHEQNGVGGPGATAAVFGALDLSAGVGFASLLEGASEQVDMAFVGTTLEDSYLWYKLLGTQSEAGSADTQLMPFGLDPLKDNQIAVVVEWIEGGALP
jgi:hypothetical protein